VRRHDIDGKQFSRDEASNGKKPRRLVVKDVLLSASPVRAFDDIYMHHADIDLTGVPHADTRSPMYAVIQEQCNLGCWHDVNRTYLPCWGSD
jgi:hypothetical protein